MNPICSVIIPTYNHAVYIERAVQCALDQTYPKVEVIVVDDGSTDDTSGRLKRFGDLITYIRKENTGRGDNRNRAIGACTGKYIQFLDADDTIAPEKLAVQIPQLEADDSVTVVYSDCSCNDSTGVELESVSYPLRHDEDPIPVLLGRTLFGIHAAITRRDAIMDVGMFDPHPLAQEDWDLWLKLALRGYKYKYVPGNFAHYDQRGSSTVVNAPLMYLRMEHMMEKYLRDPDFQRLDSDLVNLFVAKQNLQLATRAYNNRWWSLSRKHLLSAIRAERSLVDSSLLMCLPKSLLHQFSDMVRGRRISPPERNA